MATIPSAPFTVTPLFMQAVAGDPVINYSAQDFTRLSTSIWRSPGVITPTSFRVEQADTVGWAVKIRPGRALVGDYLVYQDTAITIDMSVMNTSPTGTRYHRAYLVIDDKVQGGAEYSCRIKVVEDFGSGATPPAGVAILLLATIAISPGQSNIQNINIAAKPRHASHASAYAELYTDVHIETTGYNGVVDASGDLNTAPPRARYGDGRGWLSGALKRANSAVFTGGTAYTLGALPDYLAPNYVQYLSAASNVSTGSTTGGYSWRLTIARDGTMTATIPDTTSPTYLMLDGISYDID